MKANVNAKNENKKSVKNYITLAEYNAAYELVWGDDYTKRNWTTIKERNVRIEELRELYGRIMPEVGMGATEILWSDRRANTITRVITPNKIAVKQNKTRCKDYYADEYEILDELYGEEDIYTRRRSGRWVMEGQADKYGSVILLIGQQCHSIDPSF